MCLKVLPCVSLVSKFDEALLPSKTNYSNAEVVESWDKNRHSQYKAQSLTLQQTELTMTKSNDKIDNVFTGNKVKRTIMATKKGVSVRYETKKYRKGKKN